MIDSIHSSQRGLYCFHLRVYLSNIFRICSLLLLLLKVTIEFIPTIYSSSNSINIYIQ